jgi:hypothetical protein
VVTLKAYQSLNRAAGVLAEGRIFLFAFLLSWWIFKFVTQLKPLRKQTNKTTMKVSFKLLLAIALIVSAGQLSAQSFTPSHNNQARATETRKVYGFTKINLSGPYNYFIKMGTSESLRIEASKNVLPYIVNEVKNGTLSVYEKKGPGVGAISKTEKIDIYITSKEISSIQLSGSGNVVFKDGITASTLHLAMSGFGFFTGKVKVATLDCILNGTGSINLSGAAGNANVKVTGSGNFMGSDLKALYTNVEVNGYGIAWINAAKSLNAKVTGSGSVHYNGNPKSITKSNTGGGLIVKG